MSILKLMQLSDSAVPIGSAAHSWGLESLIEEQSLNVSQLATMLDDYIVEAGALEAGFCRDAYEIANEWRTEDWIALNCEVAATKPARESRTASATMGRRLLALAAGLDAAVPLAEAIAASKATDAEIHHCAAFGLIGGALGVSDELTVSMFVQQMVASLISACQRLMPLGQTDASRLAWNLKDRITKVAATNGERMCFTPMLEIASMRHPDLTTRLFIS